MLYIVGSCCLCILYIVVCILEKAVAPHSRTLAGKIPWTEEPSRLPSTGALRVRHDWVTSPSLFTFMRWRRTWQPTLVFLLGESQGRGSLVGCCLWGHTVRHDWNDLAAAVAAVVSRSVHFAANGLISFFFYEWVVSTNHEREDPFDS